MFYAWLNNIIEEVNSVIKNIFRDKIFLLCFTIAIIVILFSLLFELNKIEWLGVIFAVSMSMALALKYSYVQTERGDKKIVAGGRLLLQIVMAIIIGITIFYDKPMQDISYVYTRIHGNIGLLYLLCLVAPSIIAIAAKIIFQSGNPLYGGIVSGHAGFVTTMFFINSYSGAPLVLLILPSLSILVPRCIELKTLAVKWFLKVAGGISMLTLCISTIVTRENFILVGLNFLMLALAILCQGKKVHKKREICLGIIAGTLCSIIILGVFG